MCSPIFSGINYFIIATATLHYVLAVESSTCSLNTDYIIIHLFYLKHNITLMLNFVVYFISSFTKKTFYY